MTDTAVLLRRVGGVRPDASGVTLDLDALPGVQLGMMPGWLTGRAAGGPGGRDPDAEPSRHHPAARPTSRRTRCGSPLRSPAACGWSSPRPGTPRSRTTAPASASSSTPTPAPAALDVEEHGDRVVLRAGGLRLTVGRAPFTLILTDVETGATVLRTRGPAAPGRRAADRAVGRRRRRRDDAQPGARRGRGHPRLRRAVQPAGQERAEAARCAARTPAAPARGWPTSRCRCGTRRGATPGSSTPARSSPPTSATPARRSLSIGVDDAVIDLYVVAGADPAARLDRIHRADRPAGRAAAVGLRLLDGALPLPHQRGDARGRPDDAASTRCRSTCCTSTPTGSSSTGSTPTSSGTPHGSATASSSSPTSRTWASGCRCGSSPTSTRPRRSSSTPSARGTSSSATDGSLAGDRQDADPRRTDAGAHRLHQPGRAAVVAGDAPRVPRRRRGRFKTDFGEALPDDVALFDGTPPHQAHNLYPLRYNGAVSDAIREFTDRPRWSGAAADGPARSATRASGVATPSRRSRGCRRRCAAGSRTRMSAPGFWSHDIGGFFGPELTPKRCVPCASTLRLDYVLLAMACAVTWPCWSCPISSPGPGRTPRSRATALRRTIPPSGPRRSPGFGPRLPISCSWPRPTGTWSGPSSTKGSTSPTTSVSTIASMPTTPPRSATTSAPTSTFSAGPPGSWRITTSRARVRLRPLGGPPGGRHGHLPGPGAPPVPPRPARRGHDPGLGPPGPPRDRAGQSSLGGILRPLARDLEAS